MRRLIQRFYYLTETLLIRSAGYQLLLVALVLGLLSVGGGVVVHLTNPAAYRDTPEAIWWAFLRLTDPGYLGDDRGLMPRLVSTFLTISGYVVFLGALVAIMTNWLDRLMAFLASGRSPIFERDHILVIGWNDRIHALVEEVVHTSRRCVHHDQRPAIAILCDPFHPSMHRELTQKLDPEVRRNCRLLVRSGNPLEAESLERVDFEHARSVILVSQVRGERQHGQLSDVALAKVLMTLKARAPNLKRPPNVVVEVSNPSNKLLLESVGWEEHTEAVVGEEILGRLFCQTVRYPGLSKVYRRLLTDSYGDSLLLLDSKAARGASGKLLRDLVDQLPDGLPIGYLPKGGKQADLRLLDLDHTLAEDDLLVMVATGSKAAPRPVPTPAQLAVPVFAGWSKTIEHPPVRRVLCVGWSTFLISFLSETTDYAQESFEVTLVWDGDMPRERERLLRLMESYPNLKLTFLIGTLADEDEVARFAPERFDTVVLLADQRRDPLVGDAETVLHFVLLDRYFAHRQSKVWFVVELNDEDNRLLINSRDADVIMSAEIVSHLLAQVAIHRSLAWIYEELFTKGGSELRLRGLSSLGSSGEELTFEACQRSCLANKAVAVGIRRETDVVLHPPAGERLSGNDKLVVIEWE
jgi:hypothetical protein